MYSWGASKMRFILFLLIGLPLCGQNRTQLIGVPSSWAQGTQNVTSAIWVAANWQPYVSKQVTEFRIRMTTANAVATGDLSLDIQDNTGTAGAPGTSLGAGCTGTNSTSPANNTWLAVTGLTCNLTKYTNYRFVYKNSGASTAVVRTLTGTNDNIQTGRSNGAGYWNATSCGTTCVWANAANGQVLAFWIKYSDGTADGYPYEGVVSSFSSTQKIYGGRDQGIFFQMLTNLNMNVRGFVCNISKTSSPTGDLVGTLYSDNGTSLSSLGTATIPNATILATTSSVPFYFDVAALTSGSSYAITLHDSAGGDTSSNNFGIPMYNIDTSNSTINALVPFMGTLLSKTCTTTCTTDSNWTTDNTVIPVCNLIVDSFTSSGGSAQTSWSSGH